MPKLSNDYQTPSRHIYKYTLILIKEFLVTKMVNIEKIKALVKKLLDNESSGHGFDHVIRVYDLSLKFLNELDVKTRQSLDQTLVKLASLLHDVDDYKIFGEENAKNLTNARQILNDTGVSPKTQEQVLDIILTMGYNKLLAGVRPKSIEGKIVSDADMCDAIGASGIVRTHLYSISHNTDFFDKDAFPILNMSSSEYKKRTSSSSICHIFEKTLRLKNLMLTRPGKKEANKRHKFLIAFLKEYFSEQNAHDWLDYLDNYLKNN